MVLKNNKGITLVELLVTVTISFTVMGIVSSVLFQSYLSNEISEKHIKFRQEANIILATLTNAHLSTSNTTYDINYKRTSAEDWVLTIGNHPILKQNYDIKLELLIGNSTNSIIIDTANTDLIGTNQIITVNKKQPLHVKRLILTDKKDKTRNFEISTIISRL